MNNPINPYVDIMLWQRRFVQYRLIGHYHCQPSNLAAFNVFKTIVDIALRRFRFAFCFFFLIWTSMSETWMLTFEVLIAANIPVSSLLNWQQCLLPVNRRAFRQEDKHRRIFPKRLPMILLVIWKALYQDQKFVSFCCRFFYVRN